MFEAVEYLFPFGHSLADWGSKSQNDWPHTCDQISKMAEVTFHDIYDMYVQCKQ